MLGSGSQPGGEGAHSRSQDPLSGGKKRREEQKVLFVVVFCGGFWLVICFFNYLNSSKQGEQTLLSI